MRHRRAQAFFASSFIATRTPSYSRAISESRQHILIKRSREARISFQPARISLTQKPQRLESEVGRAHRRYSACIGPPPPVSRDVANQPANHAINPLEAGLAAWVLANSCDAPPTSRPHNVFPQHSPEPPRLHRRSRLFQNLRHKKAARGFRAACVGQRMISWRREPAGLLRHRRRRAG